LRFVRYRDAVDAGVVKKAASVAALAKTTRLPPATLARTMNEVREAIGGAQRDRFGRDYSSRPQLQAPFYAVQVTGALFHTQGGLVVDPKARALRADGRPFPNLFAGGGAARGLSGPGSWGYLSGVGLMMATTLGRLAGESAAKLVSGRGQRGRGNSR
jgi:fumarate reductase flavoprotein subunit